MVISRLGGAAGRAVETAGAVQLAGRWTVLSAGGRGVPVSRGAGSPVSRGRALPSAGGGHTRQPGGSPVSRAAADSAVSRPVRCSRQAWPTGHSRSEAATGRWSLPVAGSDQEETGLTPLTKI